jgi:hypothetical protein
MKKIYPLLLLIAIIFSGSTLSLLSQKKVEPNPSQRNSKVNDEGDTTDFLDLGELFDSNKEELLEKSYLEGHYGITESILFKENDWDSKFGLSKLNIIGGSIGKIEIERESIVAKTVEIEKSYLSVHFLSASNQSEFQTAANGLRFSIGNTEGEGYEISEGNYIAFQTGHNISLSILNVKNSPDTNFRKLPDYEQINVFGDNLRMGYETIYGLQFSSNNLNISAGYRQDIVYPRYLMWYDAVSQMSQGATSGIIGFLADKIVDEDNKLHPVLDFIIEGGTQYLFNYFRQNDMNFPIDGASPLIYNSFYVNLGYNF